MIVKLTAASSAAATSLDRLIGLREPRLAWLAWRLSGELRAADAVAALAAEGLALELLAAAGRGAVPTIDRLPPRWLRAVDELLRTRIGESVGLREVADLVGVDPGHLSRTFRAQYGISVGEHARRLRVAWAAGELAGTGKPIAGIATQAGFADQSHFTRVFREHVGVTPARYRRETQTPPLQA